MVKLLSCAQGHFWEAAESPDGATVQQVFCPVCGGIADAVPLLNLAPDDEIVPPLKPAAPRPLRDASGRPVIAGYEILEDLGKGPTGMLAFKARQALVNRTVLLHVVLAGDDPGQHVWGTLRAEASALGKLAHPHIQPILEAGERDRQVFYNVLEWIDGPTLADKMAEGPLPLQQIAQFMEMLARTMHFVHERGVVHRNLKPASILLQELNHRDTETQRKQKTDPFLCFSVSLWFNFFPRITDFGLARRPIEGDLCDADLQRGLPFYLSPEQAWGRAKEIGPSCDIYALGVILYQLLAGDPPFQGDTAGAVVDRIMTKEALPPSMIADVPFRKQARSAGDLELICRKCLRKEPKDRYRTALELAEDLQRYQNGRPVQVQLGGTKRQRAGRWLRQRAGVILRTLLLVGLLTAIPIAYRAGKNAAWKPPVPNTIWTISQQPSASQELLQARQEVQMAQYGRLLALAQREEADKRPRSGLTILDEVPAQTRDWEYYYLRKVLEQQKTAWKLGPLNDKALAMAFSPNGERLALSAGADIQNNEGGNETRGGVRLWDLATLQEEGSRPRGSGVTRALAFSPDGQLLATVSSNLEGEVAVWNRAVPEIVFQLKEECAAVAWAPDGHTVIATGFFGMVREQQLWNIGRVASTHQLKMGNLTKPPFRANYMPLVVASVDGQRLATLHPNGFNIRLVDRNRGYMVTELPSRNDPVTGLVCHPASNCLVSVSASGEMRIWNSATGKQTYDLKGHEGTITGVAISSDGKRVATCGKDNRIRIWDPRTGIELLSLPSPENNPTGVLFSPNGSLLAVAHGNEITLMGTRN
jgi:eukaryotic-like serine/threonine-protein kinase